MNLHKSFLLFLIAVGLVLAVGFYFPIAQKGLRLEMLVIESRAGGRHSFEVEIADTPKTRAIGLMHRTQMAPDRGMLFEMGGTGVLRFWMKDTLIPLDMLFVAENGEIKKIHEKAEPESLTGISSDVPVAAVLELNGGRAKALGIAPGDRVIHPYFKNAPP